MSYAIRPATPSDFSLLASHVNSAYRGDSSRAGWTTEADFLDGTRTSPAHLAELLASPGNTILLAFDAGEKLVASVYLSRRPPHSCYLGMLTVNPQIQARGIGKFLLGAAEAFARKEFHASRMELDVLTVREELIAWYERRGYRRTEKVHPFPEGETFGKSKGPRLELRVMEKSLV